MTAAVFIAVVADGLQILLGPLGWAGLDQAIDLLAMLATMWLVGFHPLLLPTFFIEILPLADEFPTWTACVVSVIILRRREANKSATTAAEKPHVEI